MAQQAVAGIYVCGHRLAGDMQAGIEWPDFRAEQGHAARDDVHGLVQIGDAVAAGLLDEGWIARGDAPVNLGHHFSPSVRPLGG